MGTARVKTRSSACAEGDYAGLPGETCPHSSCAGNTGTGIYGNWPNEGVIVDVRHIGELNYLRSSKVGQCNASAHISTTGSDLDTG